MSDEIKLNGWNEWSRFILKELERLNNCYEKLDKKLNTVKEDIIILKMKAWAFGIIGGTIVTIIIQVAVKLLGQ